MSKIKSGSVSQSACASWSLRACYYCLEYLFHTKNYQEMLQQFLLTSFGQVDDFGEQALESADIVRDVLLLVGHGFVPQSQTFPRTGGRDQYTE